FAHGLALLLLAPRDRSFRPWLLAAGLLLFAGSLLGKALAGWPSTLAPAGGVLLMAGWLILAVSAFRQRDCDAGIPPRFRPGRGGRAPVLPRPQTGPRDPAHRAAGRGGALAPSFRSHRWAGAGDSLPAAFRQGRGHHRWPGRGRRRHEETARRQPGPGGRRHPARLRRFRQQGPGPARPGRPRPARRDPDPARTGAHG